MIPKWKTIKTVLFNESQITTIESVGVLSHSDSLTEIIFTIYNSMNQKLIQCLGVFKWDEI